MASPKTITPSRTWAPVDTQQIAKIWETTKGGSVVRQNNSALACQAVVGAANHVMAHQPRVTFARAWPFSQRQTTSEDPLCLWEYNDDVTNAREQSYRILHVPKTSGTTDGNAFRYTAATTKTADSNLTIASPAFPTDILESGFDYSRGAADGGVIEEGISTTDYSITDICVQDRPTPHLDANAHLYASASGAVPGRPVVANWVNHLRLDFHQHRTTNLPIWWPYVAYKTGSAWATPAGASSTGIVSTSTTLTNIIDDSSTSRTAATPGSRHDVYRCGRGLESSADGGKFPVEAHVLCNGVNDGGTLRIYGPDQVASNYADVTVAAGGVGWVVSDTFYLNTGVEISNTTTAMNKIDYLLNHVAGGDLAYIYAIAIVGLYEL